MQGMELWRPDWFKLDGGGEPMDANELVTVTRGTARRAMNALRAEMAQEYYHTTAAAARELSDALGRTER